ncbi:MAG: hypothetical protein ABJZ55_20765 [Fuerstiella sp.]
MGIEIMMETSTRSARNRRVAAIMAWAVLVGTALILWNGRLQDSIRSVGDEPVAFVLAAFSAFVGVFAWLLFNPGRRAASESPVLFFAAGATLFPPPIIGFCLMPVDSPLRGWLTVGLFLLCVIAVLSHVPDDFFGVPRGRNSYMTPIPTFDSVDDTIMNPDAAWFTFEDLTRILPHTERPSLAPRSYLQQDTIRPAAPTVRSQDKIASEVDDILGSDFDLGLLDEDLTEFDRQPPQQESSRRISQQRTTSNIDRRSDEANPAIRSTANEDARNRQAEIEARLANANAQGNVFESFENSQRPQPTDAKTRYITASANTKTLSQRYQQLRTPGSKHPSNTSANITARSAAAATAATIRSQLAGKNRTTLAGQNTAGQNTAGQTGSGLAASSRSALRNQPSSTDIQYGELDVHRGQQPSGSTSHERRQKTSGSSRQQDRRQKESRAEDSAKTRRAEEAEAKQRRATEAREERERIERDRAERARQKADAERRQEQSAQSNRSDRVSRFEQRQQAATRQAEVREEQLGRSSQNDSPQTDRKLVRQTTSEDRSDSAKVEAPKPKRRSALDIATAGILGAGAAAGLSKSEASDQTEAPDLDAAASQGLFGTVRDLFNKPKTSEPEEETTGAEEFESAVDSVKAKSTSNQDVSIERTIDASGAEMVEGVAVVRFERGQKKANVHIPFAPPMKGQPEVEVECVGGEQLRLKVPMAEPYGMRIEARRSNTSEALEAEIGFAAMADEE